LHPTSKLKMTLPKTSLSISTLMLLFSVLFALSGASSVYLWISSNTKWERYLDNASSLGERLVYGIFSEQYLIKENLLREIKRDSLKENFSSDDLSSLLAINSRFIKIEQIKIGTLKNKVNFSLFLSSHSNFSVDDVIQKNFSDNPIRAAKTLFENMARFCDNYRLIILHNEKLFEVDGKSFWSCNAKPPDYRLFALILFFMPFGLLIAITQELSNKFSGLISTLKEYSQSGKQNSIKPVGPKELKSLIKTLNSYLTLERDRLKRRIMVLSMISHDLGTPATRLKFRIDLIKNKDIKRKIETDINQMIKMIDSVLNYARSELNTEEESRISLTDLLSAIVSDYEDQGKPVALSEFETQSVEVKNSLFSGKKRSVSNLNSKITRVIVNARPLSLQRAIENLIDNSLKYGRSANLSLRADSKFAYIYVEDEGVSMSEEVLNELITPFKRGQNASLVDGVGLGLTVVTTIAEQHGGKLSFERTKNGIKAIMKISRH